MFRQYLLLTKPGIIAGNLVSFVGGFLLGTAGHASLATLLAAAAGVALVIASGCVFNNYIDRDIDAAMTRTRQRGLVTGLIAPRHALLYGTLLGLAGLLLLDTLGGGTLAALLGLLGFAVYVGAYSLYGKRNTVHGTLIGSLSGAMPPVIGYCAASGRFDLGALVLLLMFCLWQMPHSYAIAIFRAQDYRAAGIPVLPLQYGLACARSQIIGYTAAFAACSLLLPLFSAASWLYLVTALAGGLYWLRLTLAPCDPGNPGPWARKLFLFSILLVVLLSLTMGIDGLLHTPD
ncbi:heme o synthase [Kerstersia similis]|uniref:heme o synthase n=1 Tax=Kerstersia similis TaxID=206505 RepID=UPI0039F12725